MSSRPLRLSPTQATVTEMESRCYRWCYFCGTPEHSGMPWGIRAISGLGVVLSNLGKAFERLVARKKRKVVPHKYSTRRLMLQKMLPASRSSGAQWRSDMRVARLMKTEGRIEPSFCSCSRVASKWSTLGKG